MNNNDRIGDAKKALVPALVAVIVLIGLVVGATWAYFTVKVDNKVTQTTASANTPEIPLVTLNGGVSKLSMSLTADDMASANQKTYYAGENGKVESQIAPTIATVTLDKDKINTYTCSYTITAKVSAENESLISAYTSKSATNTGELILKLNNQSYDLANTSHNTAILSDSGLSYSGTIEVKPSVPTNLTAQLSLANNNKDQSFLANTSAIINISAKITTCNLKTS